MSRNRELFERWDPKAATKALQEDRREYWRREARLLAVPPYEYDADDVADLVRRALGYMKNLERARSMGEAQGRAAMYSMITSLQDGDGEYWRENLDQFRVYYHEVVAWVRRRERRGTAPS